MDIKFSECELGSPRGRLRIDSSPAAPPTPERRPPARSRVDDLYEQVGAALAIRSDDSVRLALLLLDRAATADAQRAADILRHKPKRSDASVAQKAAFYRGIDAALEALHLGD